ncbi:MAG: OmpA family protein [Prevotella sp.]|nr:OmpA family protein [Prevotella sp.]
MKTKSMKLFIMGLCLTLVSCGSNLGNGALIGGGGGALLGGLVGNLVSGKGDKTKGTAIGAAIGAAVGGTTGALIGKHMDKVKAEMEANRLNATIQEVKDVNGLDALKVTFDSGLLFSVGSANVTATSQANLSKLAYVLKKYNTCNVSVYGHASSDGNAAKNQTLSENRALSVAQCLASNGVANTQIKDILGFGSAVPVADNSTEAGRVANRRVEVLVYASEALVKAANEGKI